MLIAVYVLAAWIAASVPTALLVAGLLRGSRYGESLVRRPASRIRPTGGAT